MLRLFTLCKSSLCSPICIGVAVEKPNVRLPYSKIKEYGISAEGLPDDKDLKHPSSYGKNMLQAILENSELITIKGTKSCET